MKKYKTSAVHRAAARRWHANYPEKTRTNTRKWQKANPKKVMVGQARARAKREGVPCNITHADIVIPETCPVLGIALSQGNDTHRDFSPALDRMIPKRGYIPDNIAVISGRANRIKSDATVEELKKLVAWMEN